jgi:hypothetical protein
MRVPGPEPALVHRTLATDRLQLYQAKGKGRAHDACQQLCSSLFLAMDRSKIPRNSALKQRSGMLQEELMFRLPPLEGCIRRAESLSMIWLAAYPGWVFGWMIASSPVVINTHDVPPLFGSAHVYQGAVGRSKGWRMKSMYAGSQKYSGSASPVKYVADAGWRVSGSRHSDDQRCCKARVCCCDASA